MGILLVIAKNISMNLRNALVICSIFLQFCFKKKIIKEIPVDVHSSA